MEISTELLQKFFENKCNPAEREAVIQYLFHHPGAVERLFPVDEWNELDMTAPLPDDIWSEIKENIRGSLFHAPARRVISLSVLKRITAAAAVLILIAGIGYWQGRHQGTLAKQTPVNRASVPAHEPASGELTLWTQRVNNTGKPLSVRLPDGSVARLQPHASLKYQPDYGTKTRDVFLEGEAFFEVGKDRDHPFTVFAGSLQTKVLGTTFRMIHSRNITEVKLYTGKVLVRAAGDLPGWTGDIYLSPGEQVNYNRLTELVAILKPKPSRTGLSDTLTTEQDLTFNNASLKEVMEKLSLKYHHDIVYKNQDIDGMNFTGTISNSDSLVVVLRLIAAMNGLEVKEDGTRYMISKN